MQKKKQQKYNDMKEFFHKSTEKEEDKRQTPYHTDTQYQNRNTKQQKYPEKRSRKREFGSNVTCSFCGTRFSTKEHDICPKCGTANTMNYIWKG